MRSVSNRFILALLIIAAGVFVPCAEAQAQGIGATDAVATGAKIRVRIADGGGDARGTFQRLAGDSLHFIQRGVFVWDQRPAAIPLSRVARLQVSENNRAIGFAVGTAIGLVTGLLVPMERPATRAPVVAASVLGGALVGLAVGYPTWQTVPLSARPDR